MANQRTGMVFIWVFIAALIGLLFAPEINHQALLIYENSTNPSITNTIYEYLGTFYALGLLGVMVGAIWKFFKG